MSLSISQSADISSQCQQLEHKRQLLSKLIQFSQDVSRQTQGLEDLLLLTRPSQEFPPRIKKSLSQLKQKLAGYSEPQLRYQVTKQEQRIQVLLQSIVGYVEQIQHYNPDAVEDFTFPNSVTEQLNQFKKLNQTAVAMRAVLQEQGIILPPLKAGLPQDWLAEQIADLKETNRALRKRVKRHIHDMISDSHRLLAREDLPDALRDCLSQTEQAMRDNLQHLQDGGSTHNLPHDFEALEITALPIDSTGHSPPQSDPSSDTAAEHQEPLPLPDVEEPPTHRRGFFQRLTVWLSSPWETRWKDIH